MGTDTALATNGVLGDKRRTCADSPIRWFPHPLLCRLVHNSGSGKNLILPLAPPPYPLVPESAVVSLEHNNGFRWELILPLAATGALAPAALSASSRIRCCVAWYITADPGRTWRRQSYCRWRQTAHRRRPPYPFVPASVVLSDGACADGHEWALLKGAGTGYLWPV